MCRFSISIAVAAFRPDAPPDAAKHRRVRAANIVQELARRVASEGNSVAPGGKAFAHWGKYAKSFARGLDSRRCRVSIVLALDGEDLDVYR